MSEGLAQGPYVAARVGFIAGCGKCVKQITGECWSMLVEGSCFQQQFTPSGFVAAKSLELWQRMEGAESSWSREGKQLTKNLSCKKTRWKGQRSVERNSPKTQSNKEVITLVCWLVHQCKRCICVKLVNCLNIYVDRAFRRFCYNLLSVFHYPPW